MVTFNFSYAPGTSLQQMLGFEIAGRIWDTYLTDKVTVNLHVGVSSDLPSNVIGGALPGIRNSQDYKSIKASLAADANSADDKAAISNLNSRATKLESFFDMFDASGKNVGTLEDSSTLSLTRANMKALGISLSDGTTALDGVIMFGSLAGSAYSWNYDYTRSGSTAPANSLDFLSTAIHEIGHVLGMVSSIDKSGWLNSSVGSNSAAYQAFAANSITYMTPLDLFRYSPKTLGTVNNDLSYGSKGGDKYFSIDGKTIVAQFSTGKDASLGGDGEQASHWRQGSLGIMDPTLAPGVQESISTLDLRAMDVIGWHLEPDAMKLKPNLSALVDQSQKALADRLKQSVSWLNANQTTASQRLVQDRSQDIVTMVQNSQVYNWGNTGYNPYRQIVDMMSRQEVYTSFQTLDSMCACSMCHSTAKSGFSEAVTSGTKATGWLGMEKLDGRNVSITHDPQISPLHQADFLISRIVSEFSQQAPVSHPVVSPMLKISDVQLLPVGSADLQFQWEHIQFGAERNRPQTTSASSEIHQRSREFDVLGEVDLAAIV